MAPRRYRKRGNRRGRKGNRRSRVPRSMGMRNVFTEFFAADTVQPSTGGFASGVLTCAFTSIPQNSSYSALWRQFKILKCQWMFLPRYNSVDYNSQVYNGNVVGQPSLSLGRLCYAIDDTPGSTTPPSEISLLGSNGVKIVPGGKKIVITNRPRPLITSYNGVLGSAMNFKTSPWLNTDNSTAGSNSGTGLNHYGVRWTFTTPVAGSGTPLVYFPYDIYCKVTFACRDPA